MKTDSDSEAFLEYIGKRLSESPRASHSGKHRAAFTALRTLIEAALAQGYTMRATWSALRSVIWASRALRNVASRPPE